MVGPLTLNSQSFYIPMATTEGCLVASTNRGAKAISQGGGCEARVVKDGITRAPCVRMASAMEAADLKLWCETPSNFTKLQAAFESTTSFGKLQSCQPTIAGRNVYLRLVCFAGDAMGMNMVSKGSLAVIELLQSEFPSLTLVALSGNMCTDKKAAATSEDEGENRAADFSKYVERLSNPNFFEICQSLGLDYREIADWDELEETPAATSEDEGENRAADFSKYIERPPVEQLCLETVRQAGSLLRIKSAKGMGKTLLVDRILSQVDKRS